MPELKPNKKFIKDLEKIQNNPSLRKKLAKTMAMLQKNPGHPGLNIERIVNDPTAWSARVDKKYRISFEPESTLPGGTPDWSAPFRLLRILSHDDLYKFPR